MLATKKLLADVEVQRRLNKRIAYLERCFVQSDTRDLWVKAINISESGMCIAVDQFGALKRGDGVAVFIENFPAMDAVVRWTRGNVAGVAFKTEVSEAPDLVALLRRLRTGKTARPLQVRTNIDDKLPESVREILRPAGHPSASTNQTAQDDPVEKRAHERIDYKETCYLQTDKRRFRAQGLNLSAGGTCLRLVGIGNVPQSSTVQIVLNGGYPPINAELRWQKDRVLGFQFSTPIKGHPVLRDATDKSSDVK